MLTDNPYAAGLKRRGLLIPNVQVQDVLCGEAVRLDLRAGTTLSVTNIDGGAAAFLALLRPEDRCFRGTPAGVAWQDEVPLPLGAFDARQMEALTVARGGADGRRQGPQALSWHGRAG